MPSFFGAVEIFDPPPGVDGVEVADVVAGLDAADFGGAGADGAGADGADAAPLVASIVTIKSPMLIVCPLLI